MKAPAKRATKKVRLPSPLSTARLVAYIMIYLYKASLDTLDLQELVIVHIQWFATRGLLQD